VHVGGYLDLHRHLKVQQVNNLANSGAVLDPRFSEVVPILDLVEITIRKPGFVKN